jgi:hypothetical protein
MPHISTNHAMLLCEPALLFENQCDAVDVYVSGFLTISAAAALTIVASERKFLLSLIRRVAGHFAIKISKLLCASPLMKEHIDWSGSPQHVRSGETLQREAEERVRGSGGETFDTCEVTLCRYILCKTAFGSCEDTGGYRVSLWRSSLDGGEHRLTHRYILCKTAWCACENTDCCRRSLCYSNHFWQGPPLMYVLCLFLITSSLPSPPPSPPICPRNWTPMGEVIWQDGIRCHASKQDMQDLSECLKTRHHGQTFSRSKVCRQILPSCSQLVEGGSCRSEPGIIIPSSWWNDVPEYTSGLLVSQKRPGYVSCPPKVAQACICLPLRPVFWIFVSFFFNFFFIWTIPSEIKKEIRVPKLLFPSAYPHDLSSLSHPDSFFHSRRTPPLLTPLLVLFPQNSP